MTDRTDSTSKSQGRNPRRPYYCWPWLSHPLVVRYSHLVIVLPIFRTTCKEGQGSGRICEDRQYRLSLGTCSEGASHRTVEIRRRFVGDLRCPTRSGPKLGLRFVSPTGLPLGAGRKWGSVLQRRMSVYPSLDPEAPSRHRPRRHPRSATCLSGATRSRGLRPSEASRGPPSSRGPLGVPRRDASWVSLCRRGATSTSAVNFWQMTTPSDSVYSF